MSGLIRLKNKTLGSKSYKSGLAERLVNARTSTGEVIWELDDEKFELKDGKIRRKSSKRITRKTEKQN